MQTTTEQTVDRRALACRHCGHKPAGYSRGLCWRCYYVAGVRESYPSPSKFAHRGRGLSTKRKPAAAPTFFPPGPWKVYILAARADDCQELWHPDDAADEE